MERIIYLLVIVNFRGVLRRKDVCNIKRYLEIIMEPVYTVILV